MSVDESSGTPDEYFCVSYVDGVIAGVGCKFGKLVNDADGDVCPKSVDNDGMSNVDTNSDENWSVVGSGMALDVCPGVGLGVTKNENDAVLYQPFLFFFHFYWQNSKQNNISAAHDRQANSKNKFYLVLGWSIGFLLSWYLKQSEFVRLRMYVYYFEFVVRGAVPSEQGDSIICFKYC